MLAVVEGSVAAELFDKTLTDGIVVEKLVSLLFPCADIIDFCVLPGSGLSEVIPKGSAVVILGMETELTRALTEPDLPFPD